jgi:hypothetical protein
METPAEMWLRVMAEPTEAFVGIFFTVFVCGAIVVAYGLGAIVLTGLSLLRKGWRWWRTPPPLSPLARAILVALDSVQGWTETSGRGVVIRPDLTVSCTGDFGGRPGGVRLLSVGCEEVQHLLQPHERRQILAMAREVYRRTRQRDDADLAARALSRLQAPSPARHPSRN